MADPTETAAPIAPDIVVLLREMVAHGADPVLTEAADEIVRLREIRVLDADQVDITDKLVDLQNERDWAVEALEKAGLDMTGRIRIETAEPRRHD